MRMTEKPGEGRGRGRHFNHECVPKLRLIAIMACSALTFNQCGLPLAYKQLIAPEPVYNTGVEYFEFKKVTDAADVESEFRGFELYYRFYDEATADIEFANTFEELAAKGYRRVNSATDKVGTMPSRPLIPVSLIPNDRDDIFTVRIDFTSITAPDPIITATETDDAVPVPLDLPIDIEDFRRAVAAESPSEEYKQFSDFTETDDDIATLVWPLFQIEGKLVLYVLSYGIDIAENLALYSEPVWLGEITRYFGP